MNRQECFPGLLGRSQRVSSSSFVKLIGILFTSISSARSQNIENYQKWWKVINYCLHQYSTNKRDKSKARGSHLYRDNRYRRRRQTQIFRRLSVVGNDVINFIFAVWNFHPARSQVGSTDRRTQKHSSWLRLRYVCLFCMSDAVEARCYGNLHVKKCAYCYSGNCSLLCDVKGKSVYSRRRKRIWIPYFQTAHEFCSALWLVSFQSANFKFFFLSILALRSPALALLILNT